jgi:hypothetical protein
VRAGLERPGSDGVTATTRDGFRSVILDASKGDPHGAVMQSEGRSRPDCVAVELSPRVEIAGIAFRPGQDVSGRDLTMHAVTVDDQDSPFVTENDRFLRSREWLALLAGTW